MKTTATLFLLFFVSFFSFSQSDIDTKIKEISNDIAGKLNEKNKNRLVVLNITDIGNERTNAGKYIADAISYNIINNPLNFQVFDRENLSEINEVKKLIDEGYIDAAKAKELGQILSVEAIIIGNYTVLSSTLKLSLKALDVNSGLTFAASMNDLPLNEDAGALLGINIPNNDEENSSNRGLNTPLKSKENYNNPKTVNNDCETKNTGDYCFQNNTRYDLVVLLKYGQIYNRTIASCTLKPSEKQCFYNLNKGPLNYYISVNTKTWTEAVNGYKVNGQINIEKCKSKTFIIK